MGSPNSSPTAEGGSDVSNSEETAPQGSAPTETVAPGAGCTVGGWPAIDPAEPGPFETITETEVGPLAGEGADGEPVAFTVFRPADLTESGRCHPIVTWGNGTGSNPGLYKVLLNHLASHGFIVVASDSPNVAQGDPPPMVAGVTWLIEENEKTESPYFHHVDVEHVGATGHSQGGFATTQAGGDSHIKTVAPLCGAASQRNLNGPALLLCGGADDVVDCEGIANALDSIDQPAMLANYITADHANWVTFRGTTLSPMEVATVAWMRVHLMGDMALRPWFYGADCKLCTDDAWEVTQKMMDE
jgi:predicted dienelactone hydrolase